MKLCTRCQQYFEDKEDVGESPVAELADIFLAGSEHAEPEDMCPQCREELGMMTLLGFGE